MKETLKTTCCTGTDILSGLTEDPIKASGPIIKCKAKEFIAGQTGKGTKASIIWMSSKGMESSRF